ncbi:MAG: GNAT family N-acetyltransferase [Candidatus Marinimicrobia bacterium]|mgnify:FL=1|nr:GNAT family N-acetyltransferase [Candidatus Neomarinimicrobiota bacterium]|tara:strand:+ start:2627 stop:3055 length:429 start_codon:yes stop_codon:yes gene_type:complete
MRLDIKYADGEQEIKVCFSIRKKVFIEEQGIPESIELDDGKIDATNICAIINNEYVGTARYRETSKGMKLERFAVLKEYRGLGVGKGLVKFILDELKDHKTIYLHAQESVANFYSSLGFKKVNDKFFEAGIPHWEMIKNEIQ